jgi:hypothetical protein
MSEEVDLERKRCAAIAQGRLSRCRWSGNAKTISESAIAAAQWIYDEIIGTHGSTDKARLLIGFIV